VRFSIYTSAFNVVKNKFDYQSALLNFCSFAHEVVIAVNTSEDNSQEEINRWAREVGATNLRIVPTDISYEDPLLDGKLKDAALQLCTNDALIGLDLDETVRLSDKDKWESLAYGLEFAPFDAYMLPSLNLWGDVRTVRWDEKENKKWKWYLHRRGLKRGAVNFGKLLNGHVDIDKSDTCELIYPNGDLVRANRIDNEKATTLAEWTAFLDTVPFVFHLGYVNLGDRILRNKNFWKKHWEVESGKEVKVPLEEKELEYPTFAHNLKLWHE
jgi:hypothetical protein